MRASLFLFFCVILQRKCDADNNGSNMEVDLNNNKNSNTRTSASNETQIEEGRKKEKGLMEQILPMLAMPFVTQLTFAPMMLMSMKFMLMKSAFLGKLAIIFGVLTFMGKLFKNPGGFYSHNINIQHPPDYHDIKEHQVHPYKRRNGNIHKPYVYTRKKKKRSTCLKC